MVLDALSQLGLPAPQLAGSSLDPWLVLLALAIIWLALGGGRSVRHQDRVTRA